MFVSKSEKLLLSRLRLVIKAVYFAGMILAIDNVEHNG